MIQEFLLFIEPRVPYATEPGVSITDPRVPAVTEPTAPSALNREFVLSSTQDVLLSLSFLWWTTSGSVVLLNVLGCRSTYLGQAETSAEAWFNIALRPRKPEGSLGRTAQDGHLDSHTAPEL